MLYVGIDWAERHHDVCLLDTEGRVLARARVPDGVQGVGRLHGLLAEHAHDPAPVVVGIETDRGLLVGALVAAGYQVHAVNPLAASRSRERHVTSRAKSDRGDARVLAEVMRTDRHHHRQVAGDSELAEALKVLARAHQRLIWTRRQQANQLRSSLREFYPAALAAFGAELANPRRWRCWRPRPPPRKADRFRWPSWPSCWAPPVGSAGHRPAPWQSSRRSAARSWPPQSRLRPPTVRS